MKKSITEFIKLDKKLILKCILAGIAAGFFPILSEMGWIYIIALIVGIMFAAFLIYKYHWLNILNIFLISIVRFEPAPFDILCVLLFVFGLVGEHLNFSKLKDNKDVVLSFIAFIIVNFMQLIYINDKIISIKYFLITLYLVVFCMYTAMYVSNDRIRKLLIAYIASSTFTSILGILGYLGVFQSLLMYDQYRVMALFKDPNVMGPFLVPSILILVDDIGKKQLIRSSIWVHAFVIAVNIIGLIVTFSRGAWVNYGVCIILYFALKFKRMGLKKKNYKRVLIYTATIVVLVFVVWNFAVGDEFKYFTYQRMSLQSYDTERFAAHSTGLMLVDSNIIGYGPGQFEYTLTKYVRMTISAHNLYIRLLTENGVVGFTLFMLGIAIIFFKLINDFRTKKSYYMLSPELLISILSGIMVNSLVVDTLHWRHFWFFLGIIISNFELEDAGNVNIKMLNSWEEVFQYKNIWDDILRETDNSIVFITFEWLYMWWQYHGFKKKLFILMLSKDDEIIGFCPLMKVPKKGYEEIRFIGGDEASYMDFVIREAYKNDTIEWSLDYLMGLNGRFIINLHGLSETLESCSIIERYLSSRSLSYSKTSLERYYINIDGQNFNKYLKERFGRGSIQTMGRKERRLKRLGKVSFKTLSPKTVTPPIIENIFDIHDKRWQRKIGSSKFSKGVTREFFKSLVLADDLPFKTIINTIDVGDKPISFIYGFEYNNRYMFYRIAHDDNFDIFSPGEMVLKEKIRESFEKGLNVFDFGLGYEKYKTAWATHKRNIVNYIFPGGNAYSKLLYNTLKLKSNVRRSLRNNPIIYNFVKYKLGKIKFWLYPENTKKAIIRLIQYFKNGLIKVLTYMYWKHSYYIAYKQLNYLNKEKQNILTKEASIQDLEVLLDVTRLKSREIIRRFLEGDKCILIFTDQGIFCLWFNSSSINIEEIGYSEQLNSNSAFLYDYYTNKKRMKLNIDILHCALEYLSRQNYEKCYLAVKENDHYYVKLLKDNEFVMLKRIA